MKNNPVKFLPKGGIQVRCIFSDTLDTDINLCYQWLSGVRQRKAQDICVKIMFKELNIQIKQGFIITKNDIKVLQGSFFSSED
jgi:hypothetical protein